MSYTVEIRGLKELASDLAKYPEVSRKVFDKALHLGADKIRLQQRAQVVQGGPMGTSTYLGDLQQKIEKKVVHTSSVSDMYAELISNLPYSHIIEGGKRGGKMPWLKNVATKDQPMEKWAVKRGVAGAGFVIARAIKRRGGIRNVNPFMAKGFERGLPYAYQIFDQAHAKLLNFLAGKGAV